MVGDHRPHLKQHRVLFAGQSKAKVKQEINEEVRTIEDGATRKAQPCLSSVKEEVKEEVKQEVKEEEVKPKDRNRPELKEKANCPDCGKELTIHG